MPDKKGNLYLFEAIELRNEYDRHIKLVENLFEGNEEKRERFFQNSKEEKKEPVADFKQNEIGEWLKKLQTKRVKLNQAIQVANFKYQIQINGDKVSLAEALEIRKNILADLTTQSQRVINSAFKTIIHKEERDIIHEPKERFLECYDDYLKNLKKLRLLITQIHNLNHQGIVHYKEE
jgi:hypothetical protein